MSDMKSKRPGREISPAEATATEAAIEAPVVEPLRTVAPEAAAIPEPGSEIAAAVSEPVPPPALGAASRTVDDSWTAVADAQAALARGFEKFAVEVNGLARTGMVVGVDAALALLGARTLAEIVEINAGLARRGADAAIAGSARLSEIGLKTVTDASKPLWARAGVAWDGAFTG